MVESIKDPLLGLLLLFDSEKKKKALEVATNLGPQWTNKEKTMWVLLAFVEYRLLPGEVGCGLVTQIFTSKLFVLIFKGNDMFYACFQGIRISLIWYMMAMNCI